MLQSTIFNVFVLVCPNRTFNQHLPSPSSEKVIIRDSVFFVDIANNLSIIFS